MWLPSWLDLPGSTEENFSIIEQHFVSSLHASPAQLAELIEQVKERGSGLENLAIIYAAGSNLPAPLSDALRSLSPATIMSSFGSTEAGGVMNGTIAVDGSVVYDPPLPSVHLEVVDDQGNPVPTETIGRLRIRSRSLPRGYAYLSVPDDSFQDGWFYSGDLAAQRVDGSVSLHGRSNEVINFNGVKINPEYLDGMLLSVPGVHDLAVFSVEGEVGEINAVVGIVVGDDFDLPTLQEEFSKFAQGLSIAGVFRVTEIPRSPMGKPLRKALAEQYRSAE